MFQKYEQGAAETNSSKEVDEERERVPLKFFRTKRSTYLVPNLFPSFHTMVITKDVWLPSYEELETEEIKLSSPALKAGATHFGRYCDNVCKEYMLCRKEEADPRRCIKEGKDVTACGLEFFRKVKKFCYEPFERHWHCLENKSPEMNFVYCRKTQYAFDSCIKEHIGQDRPFLGHFAQVRIHDSTRPKPTKAAIRDYEPVPKLPEDYPRPDPAYGARTMFYP